MCDIEDISHKGGIALYKVKKMSNVKGGGEKRVYMYKYIYIYIYICRLIDVGLLKPGG